MRVAGILVCGLAVTGCGRFAFDDLPDGGGAADATTEVALTCGAATSLGASGTGAAIAAAGDVIIVATRMSGRVVDVDRWRISGAVARPDGHTVVDLAPGELHVATDGVTSVVASDDATVAHSEAVALDGALVDTPLPALDVDVARLAIGTEGGYTIGRDGTDLGAFRFIDVFAAGARGGGDVVGTDWVQLAITPIDGGGTFVMHTHVADPSCVVTLVEPWPSPAGGTSWGSAGNQCVGIDTARAGTRFLSVFALDPASPTLTSATVSRDLIQVGTPRTLVAGSQPRLAGTAAGFVLAFVDASGALAAVALDLAGAPAGPIYAGPAAPSAFGAAMIDGEAAVVYATAADVGVVRVCP